MRTTGKTKDPDLVHPMLVPGSPTEIGKKYEMGLAAQGAGAKSSSTEEPQEVQGLPKPKN